MNYRIDVSEIEGLGAFANVPFKANELIGRGVDIVNIMLQVTHLGSYVNHSENANMELRRNNIDEKYYLYAIRDIEVDEELTLNYNTAPNIIKRYDTTT